MVYCLASLVDVHKVRGWWVPAACLLSVGTALPLTSGAVRQLFLPTLRVVVVRSLAAGTGFVGLFAATSLRGTGAQQCTCSFIKLSTVSSHVFRLLAVKSPLFFFGLSLASLWPPFGLPLASLWLFINDVPATYW